jgi:hypothetical protein
VLAVGVLVVNHQQSLEELVVEVLVAVEQQGKLGLLEPSILVVAVVDKHGPQQVTHQPLVAREL